MSPTQRSRIEWGNILVGAAISVMTAALLGLFTKLMDDSEQITIQKGQVARLEIDVSYLRDQQKQTDTETLELRLEQAKTRAQCERWIKQIRRPVEED